MDQMNHKQSEIDDLRAQLAEAQEALEAIRTGGVDALVVYGEEGEQVYTLQGADQTYRVMVETINEGGATLSEEGILLWANTYLAGMLRTPLENLLSTKFLSHVAPGDRKVFEAILKKSREEKTKVELDLQAKDGSFVPVLLSISPIPSANIPAICLVVTDLTEHKRNIEIAAAERIAKTIIEQAAEAIVVLDVEGRVVRASNSALQLAGENPVLRLFGDAYPLLTEETGQNDGAFSIDTVLSGASIQGVEVILASKDFPKKNLLVSARPLNIPGEGKLGCVITMTDVTEHKQAEQAIQQYAKKLERSNKDLEDFAFIASHDLQEPLRKIRSFGKILLERYDTQLNEEGHDYVNRMYEGAIRLEKMINDLLAYSRVSTQTRPFMQVDLNEILQEVASDLENRLNKTNGQLQIGELPTIEADRLQMHQLFQNLLSNALKFHKPDTDPVVKIQCSESKNKIKISDKVTSKAINIQVEDNGIGFDMQYLDRIFQPFQRLHGRSEFEGSGIGLPICRKIVERHHGSIEVTSKPNVGSMFTITLPIEQSS